MIKVNAATFQRCLAKVFGWPESRHTRPNEHTMTIVILPFDKQCLRLFGMFDLCCFIRNHLGLTGLQRIVLRSLYCWFCLRCFVFGSYSIPYCIVLCCVVLYCILLYCIAWYCIWILPLHYIVLSWYYFVFQCLCHWIAASLHLYYIVIVLFYSVFCMLLCHCGLVVLYCFGLFYCIGCMCCNICIKAFLCQALAVMNIKGQELSQWPK